jgi:RNA polymerase sigma-70 factor (ECF subfamily)
MLSHVEAMHIPEERPSIDAPSSDRRAESREERPAGERSLVALAAEGDADAFEELYRAHMEGVARHVRFRLGRADEDVVAEVFVRAWAGISSYQDRGRPFGAWLFGIARHVIVDEFRTRSRTFPVAQASEQEDEPMTAELLALRHAIDRLPDDQRQAVELRYLVGLSNEEVAGRGVQRPRRHHERAGRFHPRAGCPVPPHRDDDDRPLHEGQPRSGRFGRGRSDPLM